MGWAWKGPWPKATRSNVKLHHLEMQLAVWPGARRKKSGEQPANLCRRWHMKTSKHLSKCLSIIEIPILPKESQLQKKTGVPRETKHDDTFITFRETGDGLGTEWETPRKGTSERKASAEGVRNPAFPPAHGRAIGTGRQQKHLFLEKHFCCLNYL